MGGHVHSNFMAEFVLFKLVLICDLVFLVGCFRMEVPIHISPNQWVFTATGLPRSFYFYICEMRDLLSWIIKAPFDLFQYCLQKDFSLS